MSENKRSDLGKKAGLVGIIANVFLAVRNELNEARDEFWISLTFLVVEVKTQSRNKV
jgi:hypothetical protein